ncbi:hypothetical protein RvY_11991 [Ramazzottius varieornatus]|uniref:BED-type domain-containing protein n=1 Tax=Ramazzottius varieornatus TaxID=947166 RepID=A0A1D1VK07_RAMVA|nr:hypothetical protein RvY_11991 [Ramazzottius varieornatus]
MNTESTKEDLEMDETERESLDDGDNSPAESETDNDNPDRVRQTGVQLEASKMIIKDVERAVKEKRYIAVEAAPSKRRNVAKFWSYSRKVQDKATGCPLSYISCLRCRQIFKHSRTSCTVVHKRHINTCGQASNQPFITGFAFSTLPNSIRSG